MGRREPREISKGGSVAQLRSVECVSDATVASVRIVARITQTNGQISRNTAVEQKGDIPDIYRVV